MRTETGPTLPRVIWQIVESVRLTRGATVHRHGEPVPTTGYMVSLPDAERRIGLGPGWVIDLARYIEDHEEILREPDYFIGAWLDNDQLVLDVSAHVSDRDRAERTAWAFLQDAYYDLETKQVIRL